MRIFLYVLQDFIIRRHSCFKIMKIMAIFPHNREQQQFVKTVVHQINKMANSNTSACTLLDSFQICRSIRTASWNQKTKLWVYLSARFWVLFYYCYIWMIWNIYHPYFESREDSCFMRDKLFAIRRNSIKIMEYISVRTRCR